jgi:hypothetical protein
MLTVQDNLIIIPAALLPAVHGWVYIVLGFDAHRFPTSPFAGILIAENSAGRR